MNSEIQSSIIDFIKIVTNAIDNKLEITFEKEADQWRVVLNSEKVEYLLGNRGENLKSLQHLVRVLLHKKYPDDKTHFLIDINSYRRIREAKIRKYIPEIANKEVLKEGKTVILIQLSGYERKLIHSFLSDSKGLNTSSIGEGMDRKLLIMPTSEFGTSGIDEALIINLDNLEN